MNNESDVPKDADQENFSSALTKLANLARSITGNPEEHEPVLQSVLNYTNTYFEVASYSHLIEYMFFVILSYSDKTVLVPNLIKTDYPKTLLKWLNSVSNQEQSFDLEHIIGTIYNISRHDHGIQVLNSLDTAEQIKEFLLSNDDSKLSILCSMIIALLSTSEQIKTDRKRMNNILDQLLQIIVDASETSPRYSAEGWHISEPLIVLVKLICYERTLDYILQHVQVEFNESSTTEFLINLLINFHQDVRTNDPLKLSTCTALCNILWSISLRPQYKQELQNNNEFKLLIEKFAHDQLTMDSNQYVPKYIENIQKAADGILCNIDDNQQINIQTGPINEQRRKSVVDELVPSILTDKKPSIMISYAHSDNNVCMLMYNELTKYNQRFDIWIDWKNSKTGYLWGKIADGISTSSVILCLLSNKYYESKSCQQEFVYAHDHLKKPIIPVYILDDKPPGWLAIHTCIMKYVRFRNLKQLEEEKLKDLIEMIEEILIGTNVKINENSILPTTLPVHHEMESTEQKIHTLNDETNSRPKVDLSQKPVEQWDKSHIEQWFQDNKISMDLCKLYNFENGSQLLNYAVSLLSDDKIEIQRQIYSDEFAAVYQGKRLLPHQFTTFTYALRKLNAEHPTIQKSAEVNKSQTCVIL